MNLTSPSTRCSSLKDRNNNYFQKVNICGFHEGVMASGRAFSHRLRDLGGNSQPGCGDRNIRSRIWSWVSCVVLRLSDGLVNRPYQLRALSRAHYLSTTLLRKNRYKDRVDYCDMGPEAWEFCPPLQGVAEGSSRGTHRALTTSWPPSLGLCEPKSMFPFYLLET